MIKVRLTNQTVAALTCSPSRKYTMFFDAEMKGFGMRVAADGVRVFLYQYCVGTRVCRLRLGVWPELSSPKARKLAEVYRGAVHVGRDPGGE